MPKMLAESHQHWNQNASLPDESQLPIRETALSQATRNLISFGTQNSNSELYSFPHNNQQPQEYHRSHSSTSHYHSDAPRYRAPESFPFLTKPQFQSYPTHHSHQHQQHQQQQYPSSTPPYSHSHPFPQIAIAPSRTVGATPNYRPPTRSSPGYDLSYAPPQRPQSATRPSSSASSASAASSSKRSIDQTAPPTSASSKRSRPSPAAPSSKSAETTGGAGTLKNGEGKPNLLSPLQKKANHIQSEQKRRANIRRGYEALCETIPALREAIREEDEAAARLAAEERRNNGNSKGKGGKKGRGKGRAKASSTDDGDKIDGRAGPRSENVVLAKCIDFIVDTKAEMDSFKARLESARSMLPPGHPLLTSMAPVDPLWEREWKGGGAVAAEDEDEEEDEESS